jgi:hypothetical protein
VILALHFAETLPPERTLMKPEIWVPTRTRSDGKQNLGVVF